ncbi:MAG: sulfurtransferase-like selenium metabolism protein YedF [Peptococcaceae bacterium]|nr:sulfurtransferase-like selenium metabolism protein YedF [Candidatus Syntrophopropionicum ammoniitolerans]
MSSKLIDCRGLACPLPVIETKKAIEAGGDQSILIIVDNNAACENVSRFAANGGCRVDVTEKDGHHHLEITLPDSKVKETESSPRGKNIEAESMAGNVYFITTNSLGQGSTDLGDVLMKSLMVTLTQQDPPVALLFLNAGVYLAIEGSPVWEQLTDLAHKGTKVLVCGTCLKYYKLEGKNAMGTVSNMLEVNTWLTGPYRVITIG